MEKGSSSGGLSNAPTVPPIAFDIYCIQADIFV